MPTDEQFGAFLEGEDAALPDDEARRLEHLRALLGDDIVWEEPPADLEDQVVRDIAAEAAPNVTSLGAHRQKRGRLSGRVIGSIGAIAAALAVVVAIGIFSGGGGYTVDIAGTDLARLASGVVTVENTGSGVSLELDVTGLDPAPDGFYYQAWMKGDTGAVTVGTFHGRENGQDIFLWSGVDLDTYPTLTVTIQEEGAGPASSGQVVMIANLTPPQD